MGWSGARLTGRKALELIVGIPAFVMFAAFYVNAAVELGDRLYKFLMQGGYPTVMAQAGAWGVVSFFGVVAYVFAAYMNND